MATRDDSAVTLNAYQGMALGLALAASEAAGEAARRGGYVLRSDDGQRFSTALRDAVLAMVALVEDWSAVTDEGLEAAARDLGVRVLHEVLGPPPAPALLN